MSKPIYNQYLSRGFTERWRRLAEAEQDAVFTKFREAFAAAGGRQVVMCRAGWGDQQYRWWGVETFPDFAAWRQWTAAKEELEWSTYSDASSMLGTWHEAINPAEAVVPEPGKVYRLVLIRGFTEAYEQLTQAEKDALWAKEAETRHDAKCIVAANSYWANEECRSFEVSMYPDIDAVQSRSAGLERIGWPRYVRARTLLGTLFEG